jgi:hypothetical protein
MPPKKVIVIRHCDKPDDKDDDGKCIADGYKRSYLLAGIKGPCNGENAETPSCNNDCPSLSYGPTSYWSILLKGEKPTKLLAAVSNKYDNNKDCSKSNRCCLILNPTAAVYGLTINEKNEKFCDTEGTKIADYIIGDNTKGDKSNYSSDDIVIVAWEHKNIPALINEFDIKPKLSDWPSGNKNDRFDLVFEIDYSDPENSPQLTIYVQNLGAGLKGDVDIKDKDIGKMYDDPFGYNKSKNKNNSLRTTQKSYDTTNTSKKNNHSKIIIIVGGIIISIILICLLIFFIKKLSVKK